VIFVTVGSDTPFSRLIKQVDLWSESHPGESVFAQVGRLASADYVPKSMEWTEMVAADHFDRLCAEARLIVAHAGMGSIISALAAGKPVVLLPRSGKLNETRNEHQFATAERFANRPGIFIARTEGELPQAIGQALNEPTSSSLEVLQPFAPPELTERLRKFITSVY
jgi:UDP-N-acetylglucosamine transferase subunit ALG13